MMTIRLKKSLLSGRGPMQMAIDLDVPAGQLLALSGPSGSGKTSLLRMVAGLLPPEEGYIEVDGQSWLDTGRRINWPVQRRRIGLVFQDYALFPHFSVRQNLRYALEKGQSDQHIKDLVAVMELEQLLEQKPATLSGGQQQRVALARALVRQPRLLLLDEPLSALDPAMRHRLQAYILRVHQTYALTTILVSHDQKEIARMADRIVLLQEGRIAAETLPGHAPPGQQQASTVLQGRIIALHAAGDGHRAEVSLGNQIIELSVPFGTEALTAGQEILLEAGQWQLRKSK